MYRQKSKSKLSTTDLKKLKKTIRDALGKSEPKQNNYETPLKRSSTVKSLTSTQTKKIQTPFTTLTRNNSSKKFIHSEAQPKRKSLFYENTQNKNNNHNIVKGDEITIQSSRWWHIDKHQLQSQQRCDELGNKKVSLQYFASYNRENKKKTLILGIQNDEIFVADGKLDCYGFNFGNSICQKLNNKVKVNKKYSYILIIGYNQKHKQQFSFIEYFKKTNTEQSQFFNRLVKGVHTKQSKVKFYLLLKLRQEKIELKEWPMENIRKFFKK